MKNKISIVLGVIAIAVGFSGILAYLTDADSAVNKATIGGNRIEIIEDFDPPSEITPGVSFTKNVKVSNIGPSSCFVRIKAVFADEKMSEYCEIDWNTTDWVKSGSDGYYYYPVAIAEGESTPSLFTMVKIKDDAPSSALEGFDIIIYAESYQSEGYDDYLSAWEGYKANK